MWRTASHVPLQLARVFGRFALTVLRLGLLSAATGILFLVLDAALLGDRNPPPARRHR